MILQQLRSSPCTAVLLLLLVQSMTMTTTTMTTTTIFASAATTTSSTSQKKKGTYETYISRRERNLDHWDAETLAAYLGLDADTAKPLVEEESNTNTNINTYTGIDASIMFYAQWCTNCHKFAPVWDAIGTALHAGTTRSNVILALFNCELNDQHTRLCDAAGVYAYPTILFVGAGPYVHSDPFSSFLWKVKGGGSKTKSKNTNNVISKASGPYGPTKLPRTVKFQGDLNMADSVLDWIKTMQGLSRWYRWGHFDGGWLKVLRNIFVSPLNWNRRGKGGGSAGGGGKKGAESTGANANNALPIGVPPNFGTTYGTSSYTTTTSSRSGTSGSGSGTGTGSGSGTAKPAYLLEKELKEAQSKIESIESELEDHKAATEHAGFLIEAFLFPKMSPKKGGTKKLDNDGGTKDDSEAGDGDSEGESESTAEPMLLDAFTVLNKTDGWNTKVVITNSTDNTSTSTSTYKISMEDNQWYIIKACVIDLALDYCTRFSKKATNDYLESFASLSLDDADQQYPTFSEMENQLRSIIEEAEPYCGSFDECVLNNFEDGEKVKCRPEHCPFRNDGACRYVNSCLTDLVMGEYRDVLEDNLKQAGSGKSKSSTSTSSTSAAVG